MRHRPSCRYGWRSGKRVRGEIRSGVNNLAVDDGRSRWPTAHGVQGVGIWTLPYDGFVVRNRLQQNNMAVVSLALEHSLFDRQTPLASARILHFRGQYDSDDDRPGAARCTWSVARRNSRFVQSPRRPCAPLRGNRRVSHGRTAGPARSDAWPTLSFSCDAPKRTPVTGSA